MPTVTNRDINGHWNEHKSIGDEALSSKRLRHGHDLSALPDNVPSVADNIAEEHRYAVSQRFVSSNSYYGYHPVMNPGNTEDCSMDTDTSESVSVSAVAAGFNPNPDQTCGSTDWLASLASRKRCFDLDGTDRDADICISKRMRYDSIQETLPPCHPLPPPQQLLTSCQEYPAEQQLPGSTSYLVESLMPRPRCLMGHYV